MPNMTADSSKMKSKKLNQNELVSKKLHKIFMDTQILWILFDCFSRIFYNTVLKILFRLFRHSFLAQYDIYNIATGRYSIVQSDRNSSKMDTFH